MFMNQFFNGIDIAAIQVFLATEGVKSIASLWGCKLKGKAALFLFVGLLLLAGFEMRGLARDETYFVMMCLRGLSAVGIYSFLSRLYDAIGARKQ